MRPILITFLFLFISLNSYAIECGGAFDRVYTPQDLENVVTSVRDDVSLTPEERAILVEILNPYTRTNIGGSLNKLSDSHFNKMLEKIAKGQKLSQVEKEIISSMDLAKAHKVYQEVLYSPKIHPFLRGRTSPRAYSNQVVAQEKIKQIFEASRWGASAFNEQPWRYIYATKAETEKYAKLRELLDPWNQAWSEEAPVLAMAVRKKTFTYDGKVNPFSDHDMGMAQANIGFQASSLGVSVHPMAGFDAAKAKEVLGIPDDFEPMTMMTMGYRGNVKNLPENLVEGELKARERLPLESFVFEGKWGNKKSFRSEVPEKWKSNDFTNNQVKPDNSAHEVHEVVKNRSSKRAFSNKPVTEEEIGKLFEAARWSPSAFNEQPWAFVYITKDHPDYQKFAQIVNEFNTPWAKEAHGLILGLGKKNFKLNGLPNPYMKHDLGTAQGSLQLQAEALGLNARQMGGIHPDKAKEILDIPDDYEAVSVIAVGHRGDPASLPANLQGEDINPRPRKDFEKLIFNGSWEQQ